MTSRFDIPLRAIALLVAQVFAWLSLLAPNGPNGPNGLVNAAEIAAERIRRPAALARCGDYILSANRRGTLSVVDLRKKKVVAERLCGQSLVDVAAVSPTQALALDELGRQLLLITLSPDEAEASASPRVDCRVFQSLPANPVRLVVDPQRRLAAIASLWSKQITVFAWDAAALGANPLRVQRTVTLSFAPRELLLDRQRETLLIADAFGGTLAELQMATGQLRVTTAPAHNIRGLALAPQRPTHLSSGDAAKPAGRELMVSHQTLDRGWIDRDGVHWGIVMANSLRGLPLHVFDLRESQQTATTDGWAEDLGLVGAAAGDPGPIAVDDQGRTAVALSGIHEVLISGASYRKQIRVGARPVALLHVGEELWVANQMDDTLSVIDKSQGVVRATISLGPSAKESAADRGERLFYDAKLSHDGWMSCHSCHTDGHTTGQVADTLGDGDYGAPKRIPSLLGVGVTGPWAWDGTVKSLPEQVRKSVKTTMHGRAISDPQTRDLVAFLMTLRPPKLPLASPSVTKGQAVFQREGCARCHAAPHYTTADTYDVGVVDAANRRLFNPPSLRGVGIRGPLFHDGRYPGVDHLIRSGEHQLEAPLRKSDAESLIAFLKSL